MSADMQRSREVSATHTPGPWVVITTGHHHKHITANYLGGEKICELGEEGQTFESLGANARLIAAAPQLLEALEDAADMFSTCADECAECDYGDGATRKDSEGGVCEACAPLIEAERRARAAIAKAGGPVMSASSEHTKDGREESASRNIEVATARIGRVVTIRLYALYDTKCGYVRGTYVLRADALAEKSRDEKVVKLAGYVTLPVGL